MKHRDRTQRMKNAPVWGRLYPPSVGFPLPRFFSLSTLCCVHLYPPTITRLFFTLSLVSCFRGKRPFRVFPSRFLSSVVSSLLPSSFCPLFHRLFSVSCHPFVFSSPAPPFPCSPVLHTLLSSIHFLPLFFLTVR